MFMYIGISISYFVEKGVILSSSLLNQSFIGFDLQIKATDILVRPSFNCRVDCVV